MTLVLLASVVIGSPRLTVRVEGEGYIRLAHAGQMVYATRATLTNVNGALGTEEGDLVMPRMTLPTAGKSIRVDLEGNVSLDAAEVGRIVLAVFPTGTKLVSNGSLLSSSVRPRLANPGEGMVGVIRTGGAGSPSTTPTKSVEAGKVLVQVRPQSEVEGEHFTIRDIASIEGDPDLVAKASAVDMGVLPLIGTQRGLVSAHVASRLRMAGLTDRQFNISIPERAVVIRKAQMVSSEQMLESAVAAAQRKIGSAISLVANKDLLPMAVPPGEVEILAEAATPTQSGVAVTVTVRIQSRVVGSRSLTLSPAAGSEGVRIGDTVQVRLVCNGAVIESQGKAISAGWTGQTVTIQMQVSPGAVPTKVTATVVGAGIVEVKA